MRVLRHVLQSRRPESVFNELQLQDRLFTFVRNKHRPQKIPTLPEDIIMQIFEIVAMLYINEDEGFSLYRWWDLPKEYCRFFKTLSLVCKLWRCLAAKFQGPLQMTVEKFVAPKTWKLPSRQLEHLHLVEGDWFLGRNRSRRIQSLPDCLFDISARLTSLSFEVLLLRYPISQGFLYHAIPKVRRLHIYCEPTNHRLSNKAFFWSDVFNSSTELRAQELALIGLVVYGGATEDISPCTAKVIIIEETVFDFNERNLDWIHLFPSASRVIIARYFLYTASLGISLKSPSIALRSLDITWSTSQHPLCVGTNILSSPNLLNLTVVVGSGSGIRDWPPQIFPLVHPIPNMRNIRSITILGAGELLHMSDLAKFCSSFADPTFCPAVQKVVLSTKRRVVRFSTTLGTACFLPPASHADFRKITAGAEGLEQRGVDMGIGPEHLLHSIWSYRCQSYGWAEYNAEAF